MIEWVFTIGAYGKTESEFFEALRKANVDTFCDIRMRRGVRGAQYSFVNSTKLQARLSTAGIRYIYVQELAPTQRIRELQHRTDDEVGLTKQTREELGPVFKASYTQEILAPFDSADFRQRLFACKRLALFCVEGTPSACHRSLVAARLMSDWNVPVEHL
jgi:hypothetical protein